MADEENKQVPIEDRGSTTAEAVGKNTEPEEEIVEFEYNEDGEEDLKKTLKKPPLKREVFFYTPVQI